MNKKNIFLLSTAVFFSSVSLAQDNKTLEKAEGHYDAYNYSEAVEKYEASGSAAEESTATLRNLASSYMMTGELAKSRDAYAKLNQRSDKTTEDIWEYAQVLMKTKNYDAAIKQLEELKAKSPSDTRADKYLSAGSFVEKIKADPSRFSISNLSVNTAQQDFGAVYYKKDKVVFASSRSGVKPVVRKWNGNQLPFLNLYLADKNGKELENLSHFASNHYNKKFHDGPIAFNKDYTEAVLTRNNYKEKSADGTRKLKMYTVTSIDGNWGDPKAFAFNSKEYSVGHGAYTPDGKTIYFSSDMPGGKGGVDIYRTQRGSDGSWSKPENISSINTEGDEMFPFFHESGILFFSSDGHPGLGGLDVFYTQVKGDKVSAKPKNAGIPVSSSMDDFSLTLDKAMKKGYFASNREGGKGDDDIYSFILNKPLSFGKIIRGVSQDKKGSLIPDALVELMNSKGNVVDKTNSNASGEYSFTVEKDDVYKLKGSKEKYFDGKNTADATVDKEEIISDLVLEKDPGLSLYALVTDRKTKKPIEGVTMKVTNNVRGDKKTITTPATGDYLRPLGDNRLKDRISYNITLEKEGYLAKTVTYNKVLEKPGRYDVHAELDLSMDKIDVGTDIGKLININPIYFDLSKWNIREDAAVELEKIVKVMNENPKMEIELGSHTDCRASAAFNRRLSDKRAKSSANWIKKKITNPERIYGKGYGESKLVNKCECEGSKKVPCSEEEHQQNRRTEFKIVKM